MSFSFNNSLTVPPPVVHSFSSSSLPFLTTSGNAFSTFIPILSRISSALFFLISSCFENSSPSFWKNSQLVPALLCYSSFPPSKLNRTYSMFRTQFSSHLLLPHFHHVT